MIRIRASALIIENGKILTIKHKKNNKEYYLLPGGGTNFGETLENAIKREMMEELNVKIKVGDMLFISESINPNYERHIISIIMKCKLITKNFKIGQDKRVSGYEFLSKDELKRVTFYPDFRNSILEYMNIGRIINQKLTIEWKD